MALVPANAVDRAKTNAKQFARGFTPGQKAVTIAAAVAAVVGGFVVMNMTGKPTYAPLFTNLQATDASSITAKLASAKIPYQLTDNGATVMVPENDVTQERVAMAAAGLPASSSSTQGLSILDTEGLTTSSMTQQAEYLQALQGELEQTIDSISGVSSSQVNIALPANQDFALTNDSPTGASVLVSMQNGETLSTGDVAAIVHLVASSIPGLTADKVTVADSSGNLLAGPGVDASTAGGGDTAYDAQVAQKVTTYLNSVVGAGNADVQVNADLDYSQVNSTTQQIQTGANGKPTSFCTQTNTSSENYTGSGTPPGGTAGTITATSGSGSGNYTNNTNSQTCETSEQTTTVTQAPGTLKSEQVAVLVNSKSVPAGTNLTALQAGVAAAAGINTTRGDQLAFTTMPFDQAGAQQAAQAAKAAASASQSAAMSSLIRTGVVFLVILVVLFLLWRSSKKARNAPTVLSQAEIENLRSARAVSSPATAAMPAVTMPEIGPPVEALTISHFIDNQPDEVASMLRAWLQESPAKVAG